MITKVQITGKMWNDIVAMQDQLVLLHNAFEDKQMYLTWHVSPWIGLFSCTLYQKDDEGLSDRVDGFDWYFDTELEGKTKNEALDKIAEWEKKYGLLNADH